MYPGVRALERKRYRIQPPLEWHNRAIVSFTLLLWKCPVAIVLYKPLYKVKASQVLVTGDTASPQS